MTDNRELTITRVFDAPRELVFKAWTDPDQFARWWGGRGTTALRMDVRPGGEWYADMRPDPDGTGHPFAGVYREVIENERLVLTLTDGERPDPDRQHLLTVTFTDLDGKTEMVMTQAGDFSEFTDEQLEGLRGGWGGFFDSLAEEVGG